MHSAPALAARGALPVGLLVPPLEEPGSELMAAPHA